MKISPVSKEFLDALKIISYYMNGDFEASTEEQLNKLEEASYVLSEYTECFDSEGNVNDRGLSPKAWKQDSIFEDTINVFEENSQTSSQTVTEISVPIEEVSPFLYSGKVTKETKSEGHNIYRKND